MRDEESGKGALFEPTAREWEQLEVRFQHILAIREQARSNTGYATYNCWYQWLLSQFGMSYASDMELVPP